jgi:YHS domain-containing protein
VIVIALLALGLGFVGGCGRAEQAEQAATQSIEQAAEGAESMMEDMAMACPVCGTETPMGEAVAFEYEGKNYHFCCEGCLEKFKEDPAAFMKEKMEEAAEGVMEGS